MFAAAHKHAKTASGRVLFAREFWAQVLAMSWEDFRKKYDLRLLLARQSDEAGPPTPKSGAVVATNRADFPHGISARAYQLRLGGALGVQRTDDDQVEPEAPYVAHGSLYTELTSFDEDDVVIGRVAA